MTVHFCTREDFFEIRAHISAFWGSDRTLYLHHPMLLYELGDTAFVIRDNNRVAAYLFGFFASTGPVAYVHLVAVREGYRQTGLAARLYHHFAAAALKAGKTRLKAITTPDNQGSIRFHTRTMGMSMNGSPNADGIPVVRDYSGPGADRVVFTKDLPL